MAIDFPIHGNIWPLSSSKMSSIFAKSGYLLCDSCNKIAIAALTIGMVWAWKLFNQIVMNDFCFIWPFVFFLPLLCANTNSRDGKFVFYFSVLTQFPIWSFTREWNSTATQFHNCWLSSWNCPSSSTFQLRTTQIICAVFCCPKIPYFKLCMHCMGSHYNWVLQCVSHSLLWECKGAILENWFRWRLWQMVNMENHRRKQIKLCQHKSCICRAFVRHLFNIYLIR